MRKCNEDELKVVYDPRTLTADVRYEEQAARIPFAIYSQREANIMGKEFARNLGWFDDDRS